MSYSCAIMKPSVMYFRDKCLRSGFLIILLLFSFLTRGQEYINTDRPDQTESPFVMGKRSLQIESGFLYNKFDKHKSAYIFRNLIRYGISHWMEVRLLTEEGANREVYIEETVQSTYPLAASTKILIARDQKWKTAVTLVGYVELPFTATTRERKEYWSPCVLMAFGNKFNKTFSVEYNVGLKQNAYDPEWGGVFNTSFKYFFTRKFQGFTEYYSQLSFDKTSDHNIDTGLMFSPWIDFQIDVAVGTRIFAPGNSNQYATLGFSWRCF